MNDLGKSIYNQLNSEHCSHKTFRSKVNVEGVSVDSMMDMVKSTVDNDKIISNFDDNAAIFDSEFSQYGMDYEIIRHDYTSGNIDHCITLKVETHNSPTCIYPISGAATGVGGELRDEVAVGAGGEIKAGISGFTISQLPWEKLSMYDILPSKESGISTPLDIITDGPLGSSNYSNTFGRPTICGYFRTLSYKENDNHYGYTKPIMVSGGYGKIKLDKIDKAPCDDGYIVLIGPPATNIGVGGSEISSSSMKLESGNDREELELASTQRANAEMERRAYETIKQCNDYTGGDGPVISSIHDLGAGGLGNGLLEILSYSSDGKKLNYGATIIFDNIPTSEPMDPISTMCNESQERFLIIVPNKNILELFAHVADREGCPYSVIGMTSTTGRLTIAEYGLVIDDEYMDRNIGAYDTVLLDEPIDNFFPKNKGTLDIEPYKPKAKNIWLDIKLRDIIDETYLPTICHEVISDPTVGDKSFLINICDRYVGGLTYKEPMSGIYQVPINDYGATFSHIKSISGEVIGIGEKPNIASIDSDASVRMALGELISNLAASGIESLSDIRISANWMANIEDKKELNSLYSGVKVLTDMCKDLKIPIPTGKDSLSMKTEVESITKHDISLPNNPEGLYFNGSDKKHSTGKDKLESLSIGSVKTDSISSPLSLVLTGVSKVKDLRKGVNPIPNPDYPLYVLSTNKFRGIGASILSKSLNSFQSGKTPDIDSVKLKAYFDLISKITMDGNLLSYHDISDGGLFATLCEMLFSIRKGFDMEIPEGISPYKFLFSEDIGCVFQTDILIEEKYPELLELFDIHLLGQFNPDRYTLGIEWDEQNTIFELNELKSSWSSNSNRIRKIRDEGSSIEDSNKKLKSSQVDIEEKSMKSFKGLDIQIPSDMGDRLYTFSSVINSQNRQGRRKPKALILRGPGCNSYKELATALDIADFYVKDLTLTDLLGRTQFPMEEYSLLAIPGGFTYGDKNGAGTELANQILNDKHLKNTFKEFFNREDTYTIGICNGCQILSKLQPIIPNLPKFELRENLSNSFECRTNLVNISNNSVFTDGMQDYTLPIPSAHQQGRFIFLDDKGNIKNENYLPHKKCITMRYVGKYPMNPNGSVHNIAAISSSDCRVLCMMPHPERMISKYAFDNCLNNREIFKSHEFSEFKELGPWIVPFLNVRLFCSGSPDPL